MKIPGAAAATVFLLSTILLSGGCASVIPEEVLEKVDRSITFNMLQADPPAYKGKMVLLGGVIVKTTNKTEGTLLEVYDTKINSAGRPIHRDISMGRFLAFTETYLDEAIYRRGRRVTIAGTVEGERKGKVGEADYRYPYIHIEEIYLWPFPRPVYYYYPYPDPFYDPFYELWYRPWYRPWYPWGPWAPWHVDSPSGRLSYPGAVRRENPSQ